MYIPFPLFLGHNLYNTPINDEIERLRHSATSALSERRDVIVVSSVSCIYGLGDPIDYKKDVYKRQRQGRVVNDGHVFVPLGLR